MSAGGRKQAAGVRQSNGPDGSVGFGAGRGKPASPSPPPIESGNGEIGGLQGASQSSLSGGAVPLKIVSALELAAVGQEREQLQRQQQQQQQQQQFMGSVEGYGSPGDFRRGSTGSERKAVVDAGLWLKDGKVKARRRGDNPSDPDFQRNYEVYRPSFAPYRETAASQAQAGPLPIPPAQGQLPQWGPDPQQQQYLMQGQQGGLSPIQMQQLAAQLHPQHAAQQQQVYYATGMQQMAQQTAPYMQQQNGAAASALHAAAGMQQMAQQPAPYMQQYGPTAQQQQQQQQQQIMLQQQQQQSQTPVRQETDYYAIQLAQQQAAQLAQQQQQQQQMGYAMHSAMALNLQQHAHMQQQQQQQLRQSPPPANSQQSYGGTPQQQQLMLQQQQAQAQQQQQHTTRMHNASYNENFPALS
ncbi:hypothetical protein JKP88DRAFT_352685 [Tribonema minus]|uniref:Uncharacterized protein n=1 Tax=Tribonema minus TaxID=303371 RepID=A0A835ZFV9_9STRA|nr:hypothetical protein JKP88DRAFT_352685 [Tribonema minus]